MAGFVEAAAPFSGGDVEPDDTNPASEIQDPNLTPDPQSSPIAAWDEATFLTRFRGGKVFRGSSMPLGELCRDDRRRRAQPVPLPPFAGAGGRGRWSVASAGRLEAAQFVDRFRHLALRRGDFCRRRADLFAWTVPHSL